MVRQTRIYSKLWGYSILWGIKKIIFFPIPEIPKYSRDILPYYEYVLISFVVGTIISVVVGKLFTLFLGVPT